MKFEVTDFKRSNILRQIWNLGNSYDIVVKDEDGKIQTVHIRTWFPNNASHVLDRVKAKLAPEPKTKLADLKGQTFEVTGEA